MMMKAIIRFWGQVPPDQDRDGAPSRVCLRGRRASLCTARCRHDGPSPPAHTARDLSPIAPERLRLSRSVKSLAHPAFACAMSRVHAMSLSPPSSCDQLPPSHQYLPASCRLLLSRWRLCSCGRCGGVVVRCRLVALCAQSRGIHCSNSKLRRAEQSAARCAPCATASWLARGVARPLHLRTIKSNAVHVVHYLLMDKLFRFCRG